MYWCGGKACHPQQSMTQGRGGGGGGALKVTRMLEILNATTETYQIVVVLEGGK